MKKLLTIILSVICIFSCAALPASAASSVGVLGEVATDFFERILGTDVLPGDEDDPQTYGVTYENDPLSGVSVIYMPRAIHSLTDAGVYTITTDTPLSIDYRFIRWEDSDGNPYYAGDKIYVNGSVTLYAVWVEKTDNDVRVARVLKTTIEAFRRLIGKFFGIIDIAVNFEPTDIEPGVYDLTLTKAFYDDGTPGREKIFFYVDARGIHNDTLLKRIDSDSFTAEEKAQIKKTDAVIYLCTGWDVVTGEPINPAEYNIPYTFADLKGPIGEDVILIETKVGGKEIVKTYSESLKDGETFYMTVTVNDSLYSSFKSSTGLDFNERCNPVAAVFTFTK